MKLIWPGIFLGTGAVGTAGGLYGNSLYLKSVSRKEANIKFEEIKSEIEKFVKDAAKDENFEDNILTALKNSWINLEDKSNNFEELKENLKENKEEILKNLYRKMEDFIKFLEDSGIDINEYQNRISNISVSSETETLFKDD